MGFLIVQAILAGLFYVNWKAIKKDVAIDKERGRYIFENTDSGGTVRYSDFDEMQRLERRWALARLRLILKCVGLFFLIIFELIVLAVSATH